MSPTAVSDALPPHRAVTHRLGRTVLGRRPSGIRTVTTTDRALVFLGLQSARHLIATEEPS